jgi:hypothetical protein
MSRTDERVWKTFVSPSGFYGLYADPKTGELRVVSRTDQAPDAPWVSVPSASAEDHLEIVKDFVSKLQEPAHTVLSESLKRPRWWFGFQDETQRVGVAEQWLKFRHEKLHEKLQARLQNLGVPQPSPSPRYARQDPGGGLLVKSRTGDVAFLRKLAMTAVTKMSEDELRSLKIPLGYVIDELQS